MVMDARELLASLTARGHFNPDAGRGGVPVLTSMDIAACLAGTSRVGCGLLLVGYCFDAAAWNPLRWAWWQECVHQRWEVDRSKMIMPFVMATLADHITPGTCPTCDGVKHVMLGQTRVDCDRCHGSGRQYMSQRDLARFMELGQKLPRPWIDRMDWARNRLTEIETRAAERVVRKIGGREGLSQRPKPIAALRESV